MIRLVLASASPRRRELLEQIGLKFDIMVSTEDEENIDKSLSPELYTQELAILKAAAVAKNITHEKNVILISADTVVYLDNKILTKPKNDEDAFNMLKALSGKKHQVYTGVCVMRMKDSKSVSRYEKTDVYFKELTDRTIKNYINTNEPKDKAGSYGIQGKGALLIDKIDGDYFNVVGLPLRLLSEILYDEFDIDIFDKEFIYES